jgi:hypothetical protein
VARELLRNFPKGGKKRRRRKKGKGPDSGVPAAGEETPESAAEAADGVSEDSPGLQSPALQSADEHEAYSSDQHD